MSIDFIIIIILAIVAVGLIIYNVIQYFKRKNAGIDLDEEEFSKNLRRVQLVDVREKDEFDAGHILGARNIPYSQLKMRIEELRRDKPVYLYENDEMLSRRASLILQDEGFSEIYRLKGGYNEWEGRIKRNK